MTIKKIIRMEAAAQGLSFIRLSRKMGRADTYMTAMFNLRHSMGLEVALEALEALGCEVIVRDSEGIEYPLTRMSAEPTNE